MRWMSLSLSVLSATVMWVGIGNAPSLAQSRIEARLSAAVAKIQGACGDDLKKFCSTVTPGEGRMLLCIEAHEDKISSKCDYALFDAARNLERALDRIERVADVCWNDIEKHCANIAAGEGRIAQCLVDKKSSLTRRCQTEISNVQMTK